MHAMIESQIEILNWNSMQRMMQINAAKSPHRIKIKIRN